MSLARCGACGSRSVFLAIGCWYSVANTFSIPLIVPDSAGLREGGFLVGGPLPVTIGSILAGAAFVGLVYWSIYEGNQVSGPLGT